ncbi:MAG: hydroxyacid dehydrogenase [Sulfolobales archaeon]
MVSFVVEKKARILIVDAVSKTLVESLIEKGFDVTYRPGIEYRDLVNIVGHYDILIVRSRHRIGGEMFEKAGRLRLIVRVGIGLDNIDLEEASKRGIEVINTPEAPIISTAELALGLMIMCARSLYEVVDKVKKGLWERPMGSELYGKTLCIVGLGRIGSRVAQLAKSLGMVVVANDILDLSDKASKLGVTLYRDLYSMLPLCDYISLHVPLNNTTRRMFSKREFSMLKNGCVFINTSRGGVIDPEALLEALESGRVSCAALDVFDREPPERGSVEEILVKHPKVIPTPHIGFQTHEAQERGALIALNEILKRFG